MKNTVSSWRRSPTFKTW